MVEALFEPGTTGLFRKNLKLEPKLLHHICMFNVMPRRGARLEVRHPEVPILYALMNGGPMVPFRFLVMQNIWLSRNDVKRKIIPHCRLITALLRRGGVIGVADVGESVKRLKPFELKNLGSGWRYRAIDRYHILQSDEGQEWRVLKSGAQASSSSEENESESDNEEGGHGISHGLNTESEGADSPRVAREEGPPFDYSTRAYDPNWALQGSMTDVIRNTRPVEYQSWSETARSLFDHGTFMGASSERRMQQGFDRQEVWNRTHAQNFQREINDSYEDHRRRRGYDAWIAGQTATIQDPPIVDYSTQLPYDGSSYAPAPPIHHSRWIDPHQPHGETPMQQSGEGSSSGGQGTFEFGEWTDMMTSIFGPPRPPYY